MRYNVIVKYIVYRVGNHSNGLYGCLEATINCLPYDKYGRCHGIMVSMLDTGSKGLGLSPGRVIVLCSWARHLNHSASLHPGVYKWVPANWQGNLTKC